MISSRGKWLMIYALAFIAVAGAANILVVDLLSLGLPLGVRFAGFVAVGTVVLLVHGALSRRLEPVAPSLPSRGTRLLIEVLTVLGFIAAFLIILVDSDVPMGLRVAGCVITGAVVAILGRLAFERVGRETD